MQHPFASFFHSSAAIILAGLARAKHIGMYSEIDHARHLADRIELHTGERVASRAGRLREWLPQLERVSFSITTGGRSIWGGGTHRDRTTARIKASGEILERISLFMPLEGFIQAKNPMVLKVLGERTHVARSLLGLRMRRLKGSDVYYGLPAAAPPFERNTNGCAGHFNRKKAVMSALLELIERDAFLVHWMHKRTPKHIDLSHVSGGNKDLIYLLSALKRYGLEYHFFDISSDLPVPVCLAMLGKKSQTGMRYCFGASAGFDLSEVIEGAAGEALSMMHSLPSKEPYALEDDYIPFASKRIGRDERMRIYFTDVMNTHLDFLTSSSETISPDTFITRNGTINASLFQSNTKSQYAYLLSLFRDRYRKDKAWDVFVVDYTNSLISEFGFHVVRVLCDALAPLYLRESNAQPYHRRYAQYREAMHMPGAGVTPNPWPHPFP